MRHGDLTFPLHASLFGLRVIMVYQSLQGAGISWQDNANNFLGC